MVGKNEWCEIVVYVSISELLIVFYMKIRIIDNVGEYVIRQIFVL